MNDALLDQVNWYDPDWLISDMSDDSGKPAGGILIDHEWQEVTDGEESKSNRRRD
jgi:hypothetical protein